MSKHEITIKSADNGGYIVRHHQDDMTGPYKPPKETVHGTHEEMIEHVAKQTAPTGESKVKGKTTLFKGLATQKVMSKMAPSGQKGKGTQNLNGAGKGAAAFKGATGNKQAKPVKTKPLTPTTPKHTVSKQAGGTGKGVKTPSGPGKVASGLKNSIVSNAAASRGWK